MSAIGVSEIQFAFTFFNYYAKLHPDFSFFVPSLMEEGDDEFWAGGSDLVIDGQLFIQFKLSEYMYGKSSREINGGFIKKGIGFYRFNIKNSPDSYQYEQLREIAKLGYSQALYVAPFFSVKEDSLNSFHNIVNPKIALNKYTFALDLNCFPDTLQMPLNDISTVCYYRRNNQPTEVLTIIRKKIRRKKGKPIPKKDKDKKYLLTSCCSKMRQLSEFKSTNPQKLLTTISEIIKILKEVEKRIEHDNSEAEPVAKEVGRFDEIDKLSEWATKQLKFKTFKLNYLKASNAKSLIREFQHLLLTEYNIFWIPVKQKK